MTSASEVFRVFLRLGLTSFGGPVAHLGYFRAEFVERRRWLDERAYADLVALCQFLPGPASSQTGFAIGYLRAGYRGALAAWVAFTLPSAALMLAFAFGADLWRGPWATGTLHGLKLAAVAVVAQAVLGMARSLAPDRSRASIAVFALAATTVAPESAAQIGAIIIGGAAGLVFCRGEGIAVATAQATRAPSRRLGLVFLALYALGLAASAWSAGGVWALFGAFYRSGALVFGGGHVVLPLLRAAVVAPGYVGEDSFLQAYGAAQALPGPLFAVAAYLGAAAKIGPGGVAGGLIALVALFAPGLLALLGALPFWRALASDGRARAAIAGLNAAVVGLLGAALYDPVFVGAVRSGPDLAIAAAAFVLLVVWSTPPLVAVGLCAAAGAWLG